MSALLFGSISTVADTSELQRQAFNQAFAAHGLPWQWDRDDYRDMLSTSGGQDRIEDYAQAKGQTVDAQAVHASKSEIFQASLSAAALEPRAGVVDAIKEAKSNGWKVGLVTTTSRDNITALLAALSPAVQAADFDVIVDVTSVERPKPDKAAYAYAIQTLHEGAGSCVAIEDNVDGVEAAVAAGVACAAFPNVNTTDHNFAAAERVVDRIDLDELQQLANNR